MRARQIAVELRDGYRAAMVVGLAMLPQPTARRVVPQPDKQKRGLPLMAGLAAVVVVIGTGAFLAQAMLPKEVAAAVASTAPIAGVPATAASGAPAVVTQAPVESSATPPSAPDATQAPVRTAPARATAPTPPPAVQTVSYSTRLPNGTTVSYTGPNGVQQGAVLQGALSVRVAGAYAGTEPLTLYVGPLGSSQAVTLSPDRNGDFIFSLRVTSARGTVPITFSLGTNGELRALGTIAVR
jgi:hypothetical protein